MTSLEISNACLTFGRGVSKTVALNDISFTIPSGGALGLVGESGSGKSTLARAVAGLRPLDSGTIRVGGVDIRDVEHRRRRNVQMVFQDPYSSLNPAMSIGHSIAEVARTRGHQGAAVGNRVNELLDAVRLPAVIRDRYPSQLSGGMRQRVAVARALAAEPEILIADEITSALDASVQSAVLNLVREIRQEFGLTMLFISHNLAVVRYIAEVTAVMYKGQLVEIGSSPTLISHPTNEYTKELIASIPRPGGLDDLDPIA
ncbi:ABC transporter ATP-binding protein [Paenarthrobacter sp. NPDC089714]|uniref:ABC transporter ATP-binding protein n=1 Tax=Paenarthrobacter sp. NPDC089714 TaxID=3364377 RepID=UPI0037FF59EE